MTKSLQDQLLALGVAPSEHLQNRDQQLEAESPHTWERHQHTGKAPKLARALPRKQRRLHCAHTMAEPVGWCVHMHRTWHKLRLEDLERLKVDDCCCGLQRDLLLVI